MNFHLEIIEHRNCKVQVIDIKTNEFNTLNSSTMKELAQILDTIQKDETIHSAILTSTNPKFFCNGLDAASILNTQESKLSLEVSEICVLFGQILKFDKPLIAEITGYALGAGAVLSIGSDYRFFVSDGARFGFTEVLFGLPLPAMFVDRIEKIAKPEWIRKICLESQTLKAVEALDSGLVDQIAERDSLRKLSLKKVYEISRLPYTAFRITKTVLNQKILSNFEMHLKQARSWIERVDIKKDLFAKLSKTINSG